MDHLEGVIGIDLGGTKIEMGIVDGQGKVMHAFCLPTKAKEGPAAVVQQLAEGISELETKGYAIKGIGIGVPGQVDGHHHVLFAPNLTDWVDVPLGQLLHEITNLPVAVLNDVRAIATGECKFGAGASYKDSICMMIGTGIGGAIQSEGRLLTGASNTCGEIGHMTIDFHGAECTCGNRGCLETFAGGWGIARQAKESISFYGEAGNMMLQEAKGDVANVTAKIVINAYRKNDRLAQLIVERVKTALTAGCINLIHALNPSCLILGGGIVNGLPEIVPWVSIGVHESALKASLKGLKITKAALGSEGGVIGAATYAMELVKNGI
ncbi:MAG: ROK family protein [Parachlamydia sp.]|jgi:glucokinase|nr:ROK family protein [Parachlamydia sp.]